MVEHARFGKVAIWSSEGAMRFRRGFTDYDFADGASTVLDAVFALGDVDAIATRVGAFHSAGADHVAIQVITSDMRSVLPRAAWRALAGALALSTQ